MLRLFRILYQHFFPKKHSGSTTDTCEANADTVSTDPVTNALLHIEHNKLIFDEFKELIIAKYPEYEHNLSFVILRKDYCESYFYSEVTDVHRELDRYINDNYNSRHRSNELYIAIILNHCILTIIPLTSHTKYTHHVYSDILSTSSAMLALENYIKWREIRDALKPYSIIGLDHKINSSLKFYTQNESITIQFKCADLINFTNMRTRIETPSITGMYTTSNEINLGINVTESIELICSRIDAINSYIDNLKDLERTLLRDKLHSVIYLNYSTGHSCIIYTHASDTVDITDTSLTYTDLFTGLRNKIMMREISRLSIDDLKGKHTTLLPHQYKTLFHSNILESTHSYDPNT